MNRFAKFSIVAMLFVAAGCSTTPGNGGAGGTSPNIDEPDERCKRDHRYWRYP